MGLRQLLWPMNGDVRGKGKTREIYYRGEWHQPRAQETIVKGDRVKVKIVTNPYWKKAQRAAKRRGHDV